MGGYVAFLWLISFIVLPYHFSASCFSEKYCFQRTSVIRIPIAPSLLYLVWSLIRLELHEVHVEGVGVSHKS